MKQQKFGVRKAAPFGKVLKGNARIIWSCVLSVLGDLVIPLTVDDQNPAILTFSINAKAVPCQPYYTRIGALTR